MVIMRKKEMMVQYLAKKLNPIQIKCEPVKVRFVVEKLVNDKQDIVSTSPALLAGLWSFFSTMDILELYDIDKVFSIRKELINFMESCKSRDYYPYHRNRQER